MRNAAALERHVSLEPIAPPPHLTADKLWFWTGVAWMKAAEQPQTAPPQAALPPASLALPSSDGMVAAARPLAATTFNASSPPAPGAPVPADCVWARHPYPGPVKGKPSGNPTKRLLSMGVLIGRPFSEIQAIAGRPASARELVGGQHHYSWTGKDFWSTVTTTTLLFDRYGVCAAIVAETTKKSSSGLAVGVGIGI